MKSKVFPYESIKTQDLGGGVSRKVLAYCQEMMIVEVSFEKGGVGTVHKHSHIQNTYVKEGKFEFSIEGEVVTVSPGDTITFASNAEHGTLCLEKGVLIDIFTPMREDFLS